MPSMKAIRHKVYPTIFKIRLHLAIKVEDKLEGSSAEYLLQITLPAN